MFTYPWSFRKCVQNKPGVRPLWQVIGKLAFVICFLFTHVYSPAQQNGSASVQLTLSEDSSVLDSLSIYVDRTHVNHEGGRVDRLAPGLRRIEVLQQRLNGEARVADIELLLLPGDVHPLEVYIPVLLDSERTTLDRYVEEIDRLVAEDRRMDSLEALLEFGRTLVAVERFSPLGVQRYEWYYAEREHDLVEFDENADHDFTSITLFGGYGHGFSGVGMGIGITGIGRPSADAHRLLFDFYMGLGVTDGIDRFSMALRFGVGLSDHASPRGFYSGLSIGGGGVGTTRRLHFFRDRDSGVEEPETIGGLTTALFVDYYIGAGFRVMSEVGVAFLSKDELQGTYESVDSILPALPTASFGVSVSPFTP